MRVGVPWLGWTDGTCRFCRSGRENLCDQARFTGYQLDGGFAEETVADERYCLRIPESYADLEVAPLLCAGLIGYRSLVMTGDAERLGLYGFGASAHIIAQVARSQARRVFAFTRAGDEEGQRFARSLGAEWAGSSTERPPEELDAAIIFAPVGELVPAALAAVAKGGVVVCAGIHMSEIPRSRTTCCGASGHFARSQTSLAGTARSSCSSLLRCRFAPRSGSFGWKRRTKRCSTCAPASYMAPPC